MLSCIDFCHLSVTNWNQHIDFYFIKILILDCIFATHPSFSHRRLTFYTIYHCKFSTSLPPDSPVLLVSSYIQFKSLMIGYLIKASVIRVCIRVNSQQGLLYRKYFNLLKFVITTAWWWWHFKIDCACPCVSLIKTKMDWLKASLWLAIFCQTIYCSKKPFFQYSLTCLSMIAALHL